MRWLMGGGRRIILVDWLIDEVVDEVVYEVVDGVVHEVLIGGLVD